MWLTLLYIALLYLQCIEGSYMVNTSINALDGHGNPVAWWVVLKLPMQVRIGDSEKIQPTPCDCPAPDCTGLATQNLDVKDRASGLCYLYADANSPKLRYFRELGYDCLGQGGNDPLSHTIRQLQRRQHSNGFTDDPIPNESYWAIFNDQLNGIADSASQIHRSRYDKRICSGSDVFNAHAKGAIAFNTGSNSGMYLQTSTPNYPDPSDVQNRRDPFIPLGCQQDNNLKFAQHMLSLSMTMEELNDKLGKNLQAARLCSGNFYQGLRATLASDNFYRDAVNSSRSSMMKNLYSALLDPQLAVMDQPEPVSLRIQTSPLHQQDGTENSPLVINSDAATVTATIKSARTAVPPWTLVARALDSDLSVATWWDESFGTPNICAGDSFNNTRESFCLDDAAHHSMLNANGSARFNIENLIEATWTLPNSTKLRWHLIGGVTDGNHGKWGVVTPRVANSKVPPFSTFADMNMEGFPCSSTCTGSQNGRGGSFFSIPQPELYESLVHSIIAKACRCVPPKAAAGDTSFTSLRMCHFGCWSQVEAHYKTSDLPVMSDHAASFWNQF